MTAQQESRLVDAALRGNRDAYGELVKTYQNPLYNSMIHIVCSPVDAEDIVQEAFVKALLKLHQFERRRSFYTWLYRIATNLALRHLRYANQESSLDLQREFHGHETIDESESPEEKIMREEQATGLLAALAELDADQRAVLILREFEGCDYQTIGTILELKPGTVRSRLHRARTKLREVLETASQIGA
jgi:RNA polymerase sigma-70 factor (ECF subfamily)